MLTAFFPSVYPAPGLRASVTSSQVHPLPQFGPSSFPKSTVSRAAWAAPNEMVSAPLARQRENPQELRLDLHRPLAVDHDPIEPEPFLGDAGFGVHGVDLLLGG